MSISGLGRVQTRGGGKKRKSAKRSTRAKALQSSGAFCVITSTGKKFSCNFKSRTAAEKMARGKTGWKVTSNGGGTSTRKATKKRKKAR